MDCAKAAPLDAVRVRISGRMPHAWCIPSRPFAGPECAWPLLSFLLHCSNHLELVKAEHEVEQADLRKFERAKQTAELVGGRRGLLFPAGPKTWGLRRGVQLGCPEARRWQLVQQ